MRGRGISGVRRRPSKTAQQAAPFRPLSPWNLAIPSAATRSSWIAPWSSATNYAVNDFVQSNNGAAEYWMYRSLTGGVNKPLPTGQASNTDWAYHGASVSQWYDTSSGTAFFTASGTDPTWTIHFNTNCYANLHAGTWVGDNTGNATNSNTIWTDVNTVATYATDYNTYVTVSSSALTPPVTGTYDPKGAGQTDPLLQSSKTLQLPANLASQGGGTDWTIIVRLLDGTMLELFATAVLTSNRIVCGGYKITRPALAGDGWQNGFRASMVPGYAGLITQAEWTTAWNADVNSGGTSGTIPHALALLAPKELLVQQYVYPAASWDSQASNPYVGTKWPMGTRIALPASFDLTTAAFTDANARFGRIIARTMKTYGGIVVDRGGSGLTVMHEATADTTSTVQVLRNGGGTEPAGTYYNDQMLRRILSQTEIASVPVGYFAKD